MCSDLSFHAGVFRLPRSPDEIDVALAVLASMVLVSLVFP